MSWITRLARPEIQALKAYESARSLVASPASGQSSAQNATTYLDANESPYGEGGLNRYPEPQPRELVDRLCAIYGVEARQMLVGRGSDEAIDLLVRTFCRPGDSILICPPTYGVYEIAAQIQGAEVVRVPLLPSGLAPRLDESGIAAALDSKGGSLKIVFLCSPNNPTGTAFDPLVLDRICRLAAGRALVVVDEAYAEFSDKPSRISELGRLDNLVVLRTLSKAWALAGVRCGVALGAPELVAFLHKVRAPYPLPLPAVQAALNATDSAAQARLRESVERIKTSRARMVSRLKELGIVREILDSEANFIVAKFESSAAVMAAARAAGIILRDRSKEPGLENGVRISIGTETENDAVLKTLAALDSGGRA